MTASNGTGRTVLAAAHALIAPLTEAQVAAIRAAAAPDPVVVARDPATQLRYAPGAAVLFGDIQPEVLDAAPNLRWVQSVGAGVDRIAAHLAGRDVRLVSAKGGIVGAHLAEHAFALLLALTRGVAAVLREPDWTDAYRIAVRATQWEFTDRTMLVVGLGGAGRAVARRARGFEFARIVAVEPEHVDPGPDVDLLVTPDRLDEVLPTADVVMLTVPLTPATRNLLDATRIAAMKPGAILVNVSRGDLVDEPALRAALVDGRLGGAGLDVVAREPLAPDDPLWRLPNVVVTPHIAGGSPRRAERVVDQFCENLRRWRAGQPLLGEYNPTRGY
ncbi:D-2-hydroxyacid dehydrogenase [Micromonospora cathayae]|uniref:D-2-hydroxyacid dehydrogenase n=1 Tax=Micromonospora cathayae TaxID=3028804 RepID=A0ABY7ZK75_9ACTN|nr:D-2-hydroxyacid dehydrogenase [Micromonospora sp. HUAS 3]WDZ83278.1 D-2-hydroxyacid dehydrogenase [Micromonospora sp. HUAS 3]